MPTAVARRGNVLSYDHMWTSDTPPSRAGLPRHLAARGFEIKTIAYGGKPQPVVVAAGRPFAEAMVYMGEYSIDTRLADYQSKARATASPSYERAFWSWPSFLRKAGWDERMAYSLMRSATPAEYKALTEAVDGAGGFWVPPTFLAEVFSAVAEQSLMPLCTLRPTTSDVLEIPRFLPSTVAPSVYSTRLQPTVTGETPNQTPADVGTGYLKVYVRPIRSKIRASRDWLADAAYAMAYLKDAFARDLGAQITAQVLVGPDFGALLYDAGIPQTNLQPAAGDTLSATSEAQWRAMKSSLPGQYRDTARVIMGGDLLGAWENLAPGPSGRAVGTRHNDVSGSYLFDEVPLVTSGLMPSYGTPGPRLVYGDLGSGYLIATRADVSMSIITESIASDYDEVDVIFRARLGGIVQNPDAFRVGIL
jgi:HK97 family phage major capsid protein